MKKNNMIIAIIILIVISIFILSIGVFKLIDYINEPMTLFNSVISDTYSDFTGTMESFSKNELYNLISTDNIQVSANTSVTISGFTNSKYSVYQDAINSTNFVSTIKFSKENEYLENNIKGVNGEEELINITYLNTNYNRYIKKEVLSPFQKLSEEDIDLKELDATKNVYLGDIIKQEFINILDDSGFKSTIENITINEKTFESKATSYQISGEEILTLLKNISNKIETKENVLTYLATLYGVKDEEVNEKLNTLFDSFNIDSNTTYTFIAYTKKDTDETLKFSLEDENNLELFSYEKENNYKKFYYISDGITKSIVIDGKINTSAKYIIQSENYIYEFTTNYNGNDNTGNIKLTNIKDNTDIIDGTYKSTLKKSSNDIYTMSLELDYNWYKDGEAASTKITSSLLINQNIDLNEISSDEYKRVEKAEEQDIEDVIITILDLLNTNYTKEE